MPHRFVVSKNDQLLIFSCYEDIPEEFDQVLEFLPEIPPGPHTDAQHDEIAQWLVKFNRLMEIENARSSQIR